MAKDPGLKSVPKPDPNLSPEERRAMQALSLRRAIGAGLRIDERGRVTLDLPPEGPLVADRHGLRLRTDLTVDRGVLLSPDDIPSNDGWGLDERAFHGDISNELGRLAEKGAPLSTDWVLIEDSADGNRKKKVQAGNLPGGGGGGSGDVVGPASSTDNALARFDGATGKLIQSGAVIVDDSGNITGVGNITLTGTVDGVDVGDHAADADAHHAELHTVSSHSDTTATGAELETLTDGSNADSLHTHTSLPGADTDAIHINASAEYTASVVTPADALDRFLIEDVSAGSAKKVVRVSGIPHDDLFGYEANEHIDWTQPGAGTIDTDNYTPGGPGTDTDALHDNVGGEIASIALKVAPTGDDLLVIEDAASSNSKKRITVGSISGMLGTVNKVVEFNLGTLTSAGFNVGHGLTDWDKSKFSYIAGTLYSSTFDVTSPIPSIISGVLPGIIAVALYEFAGKIVVGPNQDLTAFQFNTKVTIGYNTL